MFKKLALGAGFALAAAVPSGPAFATEGERVQITGEMIDTWCYFSGVMGGPDAVVGSAHHTCALWCSAGGIPVGMLTDDGTVYMVIKWVGAADVADGQTLLSVQSHRLTADGIAYQRDGINYLLVEKIVADEGITNLNHEDYGVVPEFSFPDPTK
jgi:hypothetical protein